jgi:hypothetical protein
MDRNKCNQLKLSPPPLRRGLALYPGFATRRFIKSATLKVTSIEGDFTVVEKFFLVSN